MNSLMALIGFSTSVLMLYSQEVMRLPSSPDDSRGTVEVVESGAHHRNVVIRDDEGNAISEYQQLQTGLMRQLEDGSWTEASTEIELFNEGAIARKTQHQVIFSPIADDPAGVFDVLMPDKKRLRGQCIGLAYTDPATGDSLFVAEVKDVAGELVGDNEVVYQDCFVGDIRADLRYRVTFSGLIQDVVLRSSVPAPQEYGLPKDVRLEVWTEFIEAPEARKTEFQRRTKGGRPVQDAFIDFGAMSIGQGKAFPVSENIEIGGPNFGVQVPVHKAYERIGGMQFLIEMVPYADVAELLAALPAVRQAERSKKEAIEKGLVQARQRKALMTASRPNGIQNKYDAKPVSVVTKQSQKQRGGRIARAKAKNLEPAGYVLDFDLNAGTVTDFVFKGDTTYYVTGTVYLNGATTIEGGTVIKFANTNAPQLIVNTSGTLKMLTDRYNPAIFCGMDDDTVGAVVSGSTGSPSGLYAQAAIGYWAGTPAVISNINVRNADYAIYIGNGQGAIDNVVAHAQFVNCGNTIVVNGTNLRLQNALFYDCTRAFWTVNASYQCEHITFNQLGSFVMDFGGTTFAITNSIFCGAGTLPVLSGSFNVINDNQVQLFQDVAGGKHYLTPGSQCQDAGTSEISPALSAELKTLTTAPPILLTSDISTDTTLFPIIRRDLDTPDVGYHYPPLDYVFGDRDVTNATIIFTNGVAVGVFGTNGIILRDNANLHSTGRPNSMNTMVRFQSVQESCGSGLAVNASSTGLIYVSAPSSDPEVNFRFTRANVLANTADRRQFLRGYLDTELVSNFTLRDNYFANTRHQHNTKVSSATAMRWINNVFIRPSIDMLSYQSAPYFEYTLEFRNNLVRNGTAAFQHHYPSFTINDNLFDTCTLTGGSVALSSPRNAYKATSPLNGNQNDRNISLCDFVSGPLGPYYYPTSGGNLATLINAGSQTVSQAGLTHFTILATASSKDTGTVDMGFHYAATSTTGGPIDTDGDGTPDYLEDLNGNGTLESLLGESDHTSSLNGPTGSPWLIIYPQFDP
jgi:hypothetical protein